MKIPKWLVSISVPLIIISVIVNSILSVRFFGTLDVNAWIRSAGISNHLGIVRGYRAYSISYPPLSTVILWSVGKLAKIGIYPNWKVEYPTASQVGTSYIPVKAMILIFTYITAGIIIFFLVKARKKKIRESLALASTVYLNPAYIFSGPILGYIDMLFAPFLLLAFVFTELGISYLAGVALAVSFSTKILPLLILPVFLASFVNIDTKKYNLRIHFKKALFFILGVLTVVIPLLIIFGYDSQRLIFKASLSHGRVLSNQATNLNYILGTLIYKDNFAPPFWIDLSRQLFYFISCVFLFNITISKPSKEILYKAGIGILSAYFIFVTGAHENHLFPAVILATGLFAFYRTRQNFNIFLNISLIFFVNLFIFYWFGLILSDGNFVHTSPANFASVKTLLALIASAYSVFYFLKYSISFLKEKL